MALLVVFTDLYFARVIFGNINRITMNKTYKILLSFFLILMSGLGFSQSVPSYVSTNGLVGWWGFNGNAQDNSGNGNHGTVNGATLTTDRFGNQNAAYSYDGSSSIIVNDHLSLRPGHITISVWFLSSGLGTGDNALVTKTRIGDPWSSLGGEQYTLFQVLHSGVSGQLNPGLTEGGFNIKRNGNCVNGGIGWYNITQPNLLPGVSNWSNLSGVWVNLIATYDGVTMKLYKDGVLSGTFLPPPGLIDNCSGGTLNFGRYWDTRNFFNGKLDDIGIWNRALTQQEINSLYNSQLSQPCTTSVASNLNISGCGFAVLSNGDTVNQSGTYLDTLTTILGCDSILNQIVSIQPSSICNPIPAYVPTSGLVGWWGFNGNTQDNSGNGNHGTVNGATLTTDRFGNQNGAYLSNANSTNSITGSCSNFPSGNSPRTISIWYNANGLGSGCCKGFFSYGGGICGNSYLNTFDHLSNGLGKFEIQGHCDFFRQLVDYPQPVNGVWHNVVTIYDLDSTFKIFFDGQLLFTSTPVFLNTIVIGKIFNFTGLVNEQGSAPYFDAYWTPFNGKIDDIGIWNRALTPQEITNLYNSQLPTQTSLCLPTITTSSPTSVGVDTVVIGGDISNDGGSSIVLRGVCCSTSPNPNMGNQRTEDGSGTGSFNTVLRGLASSTTYYARSYAKNSNGVVVYGNEVSFTTSASLPGVRCPGIPTVTDIDGNIYNTVQIGTQCWTQSNLKTSKYRNGDSILTGYDSIQWYNLFYTPAYSIYNNDYQNDQIFGKLYNHHVVVDSRGVCPTGWYVPSDNDWNLLIKHIDSNSNTSCNNCLQTQYGGGALKSSAILPAQGGWMSPNTGATNSSGFMGIPGGMRDGHSGIYTGLGTEAFWWTSSSSYAGFPGRLLYHNQASFYKGGNFHGLYGFSVRCLKNTLPQVNTTSVTNVTPSTALVTGEVITEGDQNTTRGFCYSTTPNPTISNDTTMNGTGLGVYTGTLMNLTPLTTYYVRAYAANSVGTSYGTEVIFTTDSIRIGSNYAGGIVFYVDSTGQHGLVCAPVNQNSSPHFQWAISSCNDLILNGYSDWVLPNIYDLGTMYNNLQVTGLVDFTGNFIPFYWSSTIGFNNRAILLDFWSGIWNSNYPTSNWYQVRAIRTF